MVVDTCIDQALTHVQTEQKAVAARRDAFVRFRNRIECVDTDPVASSTTGVTATTGLQYRTSSTTDEYCRAVRQAFAETVRPHSIDDIDGSESLLETICAEFTDQIAVGLAPMTNTPFTPELKRMVLAETRARCRETAALEQTLEREATQLDDAGAVVNEITDWLVEVNETSLMTLGFDALRRRHETLADHRDRCDDLACRRQQFLRKTTRNGADAGICHRQLVPYLYGGFPVEYPVLATVAQLDTLCKQCQRTVRDHLVRRV